MTDKQLDKAKKDLYTEMRDLGFGWIDREYIEPPKEYKIRSAALSCIDMINSILAYNWFGETAERIMQYEETSYKNYLEDDVKMLGRERVVQLIQEQMNSILRIDRGVYTDGEGCTYNSIIWKED